MKKLLLTLLVSMLLLSACSSNSDATKATLSDVEQTLLDKGVITGEKTETLASMVGAKNGFKYQEQGVEIYEFDTKSDAYKNAKKSNSLNLEGFDMTIDIAAINDQYILVFSGDSDSAIIDAFNEIK